MVSPFGKPLTVAGWDRAGFDVGMFHLYPMRSQILGHLLSLLAVVGTALMRAQTPLAVKWLMPKRIA